MHLNISVFQCEMDLGQFCVFRYITKEHLRLAQHITVTNQLTPAKCTNCNLLGIVYALRAAKTERKKGDSAELNISAEPPFSYKNNCGGKSDSKVSFIFPLFNQFKLPHQFIQYVSLGK